MHKILRQLQPGSRVLDLGCAEGSFRQSATPAPVIRVDRDPSKDRSDCVAFVQGDAAQLPFADHTSAAVILNHSLEHFEDLAGALSEMGRMVEPGGALYVAVPDASTLTDKLYRWLARGGGHVNAFTSPHETAALIETATGLPHLATRPLCSSLSFLNRRNSPRPLPRRLYLLGGGYEWSLFLYGWLSRALDRRFKTRTRIYGWAFYFGRIEEPIDTYAWVNVCIRCGSGCSAAALRREDLIQGSLPGFRVYRCSACGAVNPFAEDF